MTDHLAPTTLRALAKRVEAGESTTELNKAVARAVGWHRVEPRHGGGMRGGWIAPEDFRGVRGTGAPILDGLHSTAIHRDPPRLLWSLDAVEALRVRLLPGSPPPRLEWLGRECTAVQRATWNSGGGPTGRSTTERHARLAALLFAVAAKVEGERADA